MSYVQQLMAEHILGQHQCVPDGSKGPRCTCRKWDWRTESTHSAHVARLLDEAGVLLKISKRIDPLRHEPCPARDALGAPGPHAIGCRWCGAGEVAP